MTPQSIEPIERLAAEKSAERGVVFRDGDGVLHLTGRLTTSGGEQVMRSIKEGVRRVELDLVGGGGDLAIQDIYAPPSVQKRDSVQPIRLSPPFNPPCVMKIYIAKNTIFPRDVSQGFNAPWFTQ